VPVSEPVSSERPRLLINGEPVRPEELGRGLSAAVLLLLSAPSKPPAPPARIAPKANPALALWRLGVLLVLVGLGVALWLLLR
jgi:hypothetical protein